MNIKTLNIDESWKRISRYLYVQYNEMRLGYIVQMRQSRLILIKTI